MTLLLDAPVELGLSRIKERGVTDRIESEGVAFLNRIRKNYLELAKQQPKRIKIIDASQSLEDVNQQIKNTLQQYIEKNYE